jgi:hypothetical protein
MFLHVPLITLVQLIDNIASSYKLEAAKEDHLKDNFLNSEVSRKCKWQERLNCQAHLGR